MKGQTDTIDSGAEWVLYDVEEQISGQPSITFIAKLTPTDVTRIKVEEVIARFCELYPEELPPDGGTFKPYLDKVARLTDRR